MPIRAIRIGTAFLALLWHAVLHRIRPSRRGPTQAERLRNVLERLGPTFVKFGQALSLRRDILPEDYLSTLSDLHDRVMPFSAGISRRQIEAGLGRPVAELFEEFVDQPLAAASIGQVHRARLKDGRAVIVKVRRPGIRRQIDRDMRTLLTVVHVLGILVPGLRRLQPARLTHEIWANLRQETDFRLEARSIRRFVETFEDWNEVHIPDVVDDLVSEAVLVQTMSGGSRVDDPAVRPDGPHLAEVLVDAYLHQFFATGHFHGDPHPGNLFITPEGRVCFHDFGLVGYLSHETRRHLAAFLQGFINQDAEWTLDAATDLGLLAGEMNRPEFILGIEEILGDFATRSLKDWSFAEAFVRVARLGRGRNVAIPQNLLVLMRTLLILESSLRSLDPDLRLLDTLLLRGKEVMKSVLHEKPPQRSISRLEHEALIAAQNVPGLLAVWLHHVQREGYRVPASIRHEGLETFRRELSQTGNRIAVAMITLSLYIAASLLMLGSAGPALSAGMPTLAAIGYGLAVWLTWRLLRSIRDSGGL